MFIWFSSNNGRPGFGCCGGLLFFLPLSLFFMSASPNNSSFILFVALAVLAAVFVLPRLNRSSASAPLDMEKRKRDDYNYPDKPKRLDDGYVLTDDGEIMPSDDEINRYGNFDNGV